MPDPERSGGVHEGAVEQAYLLIESAQGHHDAARVDSASREAMAHGWDDVYLLLHFARSLACQEAGEDDSGHVDAMFDAAVQLAEPSLLALATAVKASRNADLRRTTTSGESAAALLVDAVVLLDEPTPAAPVVHRVAALIEVGNVAHELGFWELALEYFTHAEQALADALVGSWAATARRQLLVVTINRCELRLDWACALAGIGQWEQAAALARPALIDSDPTDSRWPPSWVAQYHGQMDLLAALSGTALSRPGPENACATALHTVAEQLTDEITPM